MEIQFLVIVIEKNKLLKDIGIKLNQTEFLVIILIKIINQVLNGVCFDKARNKWIASFQYQGKHYNLGRYDNIGEAEKARKKFEDKIKLELGDVK